ncbi:myrosinase 1 isoform X2 [Manduca sexta]|uniref:myrosinase 1 isoform X2 n=1 Tax=Manduca sexta TaxID=7130 RepID=UPI001181E535|nr:myrosinase 1 isoform X2 [Manduca sexta]
MSLLIVFILTAVISSYAATPKQCFDNTFHFGVGSSALQTEGAWNLSGKGESIWDRYSHDNQDLVFDHTNADVATDSYHKYKDDIRNIKKLGVTFYRFSIAWSRILPTGLIDEINEDGIKHYHAVIDELLKEGIKPMVTMYHWDLPQSLQELGGWTNPIIADYFVDYARVLLQNFGGKVNTWVTFNEPYSFCHDGYGGLYAPGTRSSGRHDYLCGHNVLRAHGMAFRMYEKEFSHLKASVSITLNMSWLEPATTSVDDQAAAERARQFSFGWFGHPILSKDGDYPPAMREAINRNSRIQGFNHSRLPTFTPEEVAMIKKSYHFVGLNHYTTFLVSKRSGIIDTKPSYENDVGAILRQSPTWPKTNSSWLKVVPWGFRKALNWIKNTYNNPRLFITENGVSYEAGLQDVKRVNYIEAYLRSVHDAIYKDGCNVFGYTYWSLMDNYEWMRGYSERFGLFEVDYKSSNLTRSARLSAAFYSTVARTKCIPDNFNYNFNNDTNN